MKHVVLLIWGRWYAWTDGQEIRCAREKSELPRVHLEAYLKKLRGWKLIIFLCPRCRRLHKFSGASEFYLKAVEKAEDCGEFKRLCEAFRLSQKLAKTYVDGGDVEGYLRKLAGWVDGEKATKVLRAADLLGIEIPGDAKARLLAKAL